MRLAVLGDAHLVSEADPWREELPNRSHMFENWRSFRRLLELVRRESPDLLVFLGDIVDWYSDENRDFALELLAEANMEWTSVPGNHDLATYTRDASGQLVHVSAKDAQPETTARWLQRGVELHNRYVDLGTGLVLLDSARSAVPAGTGEWLDGVLDGEKANYLLFTHVPLDLVEVRECIRTTSPNRYKESYVLSGAPEIFPMHLVGKVHGVYSGHLHFQAEFPVAGTTMYMRGMSVTPRNTYLNMSEATLIDTNTLENRVVTL